MNIIKLFFIRRQIKEGLADPGGFLVEQALDSLKGLLIIGSAAAVLILVLFGILGFTPWLWGPFSGARFLFWLILIVVILLEIIFVSLFIKLQKFLKQKASQTVVAVKRKVENLF